MNAWGLRHGVVPQRGNKSVGFFDASIASRQIDHPSETVPQRDRTAIASIGSRSTAASRMEATWAALHAEGVLTFQANTLSLPRGHASQKSVQPLDTFSKEFRLGTVKTLKRGPASTCNCPRRGQLQVLGLEQTTFQTNTLAERLWPGQRDHYVQGHVFPLGASVAGRLQRRRPAVLKIEPRLWQILPHRFLKFGHAPKSEIPDPG